VYYGGEIGEEASSEMCAANIDLEVKRMMDAVYARSKQDLLKKNTRKNIIYWQKPCWNMKH
jgi:ATP-dependent Zn protease